MLVATSSSCDRTVGSRSLLPAEQTLAPGEPVANQDVEVAVDEVVGDDQDVGALLDVVLPRAIPVPVTREVGQRQDRHRQDRPQHAADDRVEEQGAVPSEEAREADLLPVGYFHVVFTLSAEIADIAAQNKAVIYDLLFRAASQTMLTIAADPRHLGARIGITAVLHTWGSALTHHPHIHMIVPGGGISLGGQRWDSSQPAFLLPVRVLGALFRRLFLTRLLELHTAGRLQFFGKQADLAVSLRRGPSGCEPPATLSNSLRRPLRCAAGWRGGDHHRSGAATALELAG